MQTLIQTEWSLPYLFSQLVTRKKSSLSDFKPVSIKVMNISPKLKQIQAFKSLFNCQQLPISYTFICAFRLLGQLLAQANLPSALLGMIHLKAEFEQRANHDWLQVADIEVSLIDFHETNKGIVYDIETRLYQADQVTLVNRNQFLSKRKGYKGSEQRAQQRDVAIEKLLTCDIDIHLARRYAHLSGDYNPIHLATALAKLLGMKNAVIHGMYNAHLMLCSQPIQQSCAVKKVMVEFNRPCYLPTNVVIGRVEHAYNMYSGNLQDRHIKLTLS